MPGTSLRAALAATAISLAPIASTACTFITLEGADGTVVTARTMEWGSFDLKPRMTFVKAGQELTAMDMPDGKPGATWTSKYDFLGVSLLEQPFFGDGMNSEGLNVSLLYLPGFAEYEDYDPSNAERSVAPPDVTGFLLSQFATVDEVRAALADFHVVPVVTPELGIAAPVHFSITDPSGAQIIIEWVNGVLNVHDETLGVMTNSPPYDWHVANARNYINLRAVDWPAVSANGLDLAPIGYGTGMIGLPGDFTPPSRFIRALAWTQTSRPTDGGVDTIHEAMRILANFQLPMEASGEQANPAELETLKYGGTQYTVSYDLRNLTAYFQTSDNPMVRSVSLPDFDFGAIDAPLSIPMRVPDTPFAQDVTP
ncbi:choloylglycine hydrolase [Aliiruegeria haliotis]|uniref:Choloylglycine hydrolase n=1 Tax=Aliiruegeria haliotis TaxID=1280846 RepID=A0A2T0RGG8_9RHOB|nr:linear amide C-N hydrolase [Aliiruegeria haliotis]PRY20221.1 choloylglycine hydrolase [Aliiruegeria haliotis]